MGGCLCDVGFRGVDCSIVECPTSYDAMDSETCEKYSEWERWGTYVGNKVSITKKDGSPGSPSIYGQGNTILIKEWNDPANLKNARKAPDDVPSKTIPYNPIEEY